MKATNDFKLIENSHADEANVLALWRNVYSHKWSIVTLVFVVALLSIIISYNITPVYRANSTLLIENKSSNALSIEQIYGVDNASGEYLQTQFELLRSRSLVERVVRELNLYEHPELDPRQGKKPLFNWRAWLAYVESYITPSNLTSENSEEKKIRTNDEVFDDVVNNLSGKVSIHPISKTQLVGVNVEMEDASTAVEVTNALAKSYIKSQLDAKLEMTEVATNWMVEQLGGLKSKLYESERDLQAFLEQEDLLNLDGITTISADELSHTGIRLTDASRARNEAESMYRQVAAMKSAGYMRLASVPAVMADSVVAQFKAAEATANSKVEELSRRYGNKHPAMIAARTDLNSARANLRAQVQQVVASIENSYLLTKENEKGLQASYEKNKEKIQSIGRNEFRLRELQREVDANRTLYDSFMTRLKETTARQGLETAAARIVDFARYPKYPIKPRKSLIVALASVLALLVGVGLALITEALNNTFKTVDEVENKLNLPVIGILPKVKNKAIKMQQLYKDNKDKVFSEAIRTIRTGLILSGVHKPYKIIMITSSEPGEGKSFLSSNLATALGQMEKVLLLDGDLRNPSVARNYGLPVGTPGLVDLINGNENVENCIKNIDGIDVMPTGTVPPNPLELLSSEKFSDAMGMLTSRYDRVIIDSPPVQAVSDALVLSHHVNAVIYVIKSSSTNVTHVKAAIGRLLQIGAPVKGIVLSQLDMKSKDKQHYDAYYDRKKQNT